MASLQIRFVPMLAALALPLLAGCAKEQPASTGGTGPQGISIAVIPKGTANSYWQTVKLGAEAAGKSANVKIIFNGPAQETDITGQIDILNTEVNAGVKGIVLAACDSHALLPPVLLAVQRGIPVVTIDSGLDPAHDPSYCYIATDNVKGGAKAADALAAAMGGKGKVGVLGFIQGAASNDQRIQGFVQELKKYPGMQVVSTLYDDSDTNKAVNQTTNMLTAHPDLAGIYAANQPGGQGAANVLKQTGRAGKIKLVSFDASDEEVQDLTSGSIEGLVVQNPYEMGYQGVMQVMQALKDAPAQHKFIDSGVTVITPKNLNTPAIQKLLHPSGS